MISSLLRMPQFERARRRANIYPCLSPSVPILPMHYLTFELSDNDEGFSTLEAMASTTQEHHAAVMAEAHEVLDWAWRHFPHSHGPIDDGMDWDHDLQVSV